MILGSQRRRILPVTPPPSFTPADFGADLLLYLFSKDTTTLLASSSPVADGGAIDRWADKSGNGNHADQTNPTYKPTRSATGLNGFDAVALNGSQGLGSTGLLVGLTKFEIWTVVQTATGGPQLYLESYVGGTIGIIQGFRDSTGWNAAAYSSSGGQSREVFPDAAGTTARCVRQYVDTTISSACSKVEVDGSAVGNIRPNDADLASSGMSSDPLFVGSRGGTGVAGVNGAMGLVVVVKRLLTAPEAASMLLFCQTEFGTA